jgi:hypothetical protein
MISREDAAEFIRHYVWAGEHDPEEVFIIIDEEEFDGDEEQHPWLRDAINREFKKKRKAEKTWPKVTDWDRLDQLFQSLRAEGILAEHDAGFTKQDGWDTVLGLYKEEGGRRSDITGLCFYTSQDMEGAMEGGGLWLAYGHVSGDGRKGRAVGNRLREACEGAGFTVEWDGSVRTRLLLKNFRWQRRSPRGRLLR